jgi:hypothetical protein
MPSVTEKNVDLATSANWTWAGKGVTQVESSSRHKVKGRLWGRCILRPLFGNGPKLAHRGFPSKRGGRVGLR